MSARTLTLVAVSLTLGLGAAWMANNWLNGRLKGSPDDNMKNVVVATVEIPFGQMIEAQQVTLVRMPKDTVPDDAFDSSEKVQGKIATFALLRGDVLRSARVAEHLGGSTLASLIAPDKRAISVRVDDVVGVAGSFCRVTGSMCWRPGRAMAAVTRPSPRPFCRTCGCWPWTRRRGLTRHNRWWCVPSPWRCRPRKPRSWSRRNPKGNCNWPCVTRWMRRNPLQPLPLSSRSRPRRQ